MVRVASLVSASYEISLSSPGPSCAPPYNFKDAVEYKNEADKKEVRESRRLAPSGGVRESVARHQPEEREQKQPNFVPKHRFILSRQGELMRTLPGNLRTQLTLKRIQSVRVNDLPPYQPYLKNQTDHFAKFANLVSRIGSLGYVMKDGSNREIAQHLIYLAAHALSWAENYVEDLP
ncbi:hypothetical protein EHQ16_03150 [Leptospira kanakyensis]|uniref:Uncharacterized protein n=1 Tax=Leptospira kanakyensis TaxID=2484968 RepID=A0A6N4Q8T2_9LEPT|nr:hypothetical protein [Leptospira kanakyensis]TGK47533.1 hypothetical protein EHQ11_16480 [Leptospira kanakyensis]TGK63464.1 hypothetical protein EHQ16_03150 [Leptospira kanakyensis]TGK67067.1 hypothetical protein EHQ18_18385 [Leptospira kanakyensis]